MRLDPQTLANTEAALREQLRPIVKRALAAATADVLAEGAATKPQGPATASNGASEPTAHATATASQDGSAAPAKERRTRARRVSKRRRRSNDEMAAAVDAYVAHVLAHPGCSAGEIAKAMHTTVAGLRSVQQQVAKSNRVRTEGTKVHTRYFPAEDAKPAPPQKPGLAKATPRARKPRSKAAA